MLNYILRRILISIPTLMVITVMGFILMELPPGDYVTRYVGQLQASGRSDSLRVAEELRARYKLDEPAAVRFVDWVSKFAKGDFGESFQQQRPVREILGGRLAMTFGLAFCSFLISWGIGIPLGIYSATRQYSWQDNVFTVLAFIGLGLPAFLVALLLLVVGFNVTGEVLTGLISPKYANQPWSPEKVADLLKHLWIPITAVVVTGTAWVMRVMRGNLLDELRVNYVQAARARGLSEHTVIVKHAARNAMHPLVMALGGVLAWMIGGSPIVEQVLDLPTIGPVYITATQNQDIYLAGTILILISFLLVLGNLLADIALAWLDPRIRYD
jgi:peptide/nickel transport system permease protein